MRIQAIHSTRFKLIVNFLVVCFLVGGTSLFIGGHLLYNAVVREAESQVKLALSATRDVYNTQIRYVNVALNITSLGSGFRTAFFEHDIADLRTRLERLKQHAGLDFVGVVTATGQPLCRTGPNAVPGTTEPALSVDNTIARYVTSHKEAVAGTVVLPRSFLHIENPDLAERIQFYSTGTEGRDMACLAIAAAIPVFENTSSGEIAGALYGGIVLNQSTDLVDMARKTFFLDEIQKKIDAPTVTLFFDDVRVATNMTDEKGLRAIGTRAPETVRQDVLTMGKQITTRLPLAGKWHMAAYQPIEDILGRRVGMMGIAVPESTYTGVQKKIFFFFLLATCIGACVAIGMGYLLAYQIMRPIHRLIKASQEVSEGSLAPDIGAISRDPEIAILQKTFQHMIEKMKQRRMESQDKIFQSEKQASVGRLAAGVAHEINNPLTGVLTYTHMLLRRNDLADDVRSDLTVIVESTERVRKIVKGLLDFSRQTRLDPEATEINRLIEATVKLIENQALIKGVAIHFHPGESLPALVIDRSQMQSVLLNMIINALDASEPSDTIEIATAMARSAGAPGRNGVEITVADTGCGIPPENLDKLFDPFFSTKEVGKGTGLGLSVSFGIVKEHNGNIRVQSEVGVGSTFFIWLPVETTGQEK
ncbi:ATP-binding protein [Desulfosudis oleivorans]|uniref:histidine kinase n=1 Tax=Desulfosudis oleivorans (strain DSM 6200 / JCM 39069 / Hxd3) TaxID=96561 RepID=A8ZVY9_DESOH|nr:ATP-binding protein [Desulfosudis oleivorans]ABW66698.1 histidine kinase [Desulfosudis oleivorans Hxd3]